MMPRSSEGIAEVVDDEVEILVRRRLDREVDRVVREIVEYLREQAYPITANEVLEKWRRS